MVSVFICCEHTPQFNTIAFLLEYALKAAKSAGLTAVGSRGKDAVCVAIQKKVAEKLMDASYVTSVHKITKRIGCVTTGIAPDGAALVQRARQIAAEFADKNGYEIPVHFLSQKLADMEQVYTQHAYMRPYAVNAILFAVDDERGPQLFKVDPAGHFSGYSAVASGPKEQEAFNSLERRKNFGEATEEETIHTALATLQTVCGGGFKARDVEVALTDKNGVFRKLSDEEVEEVLTAIAEKD